MAEAVQAASGAQQAGDAAQLEAGGAVLEAGGRLHGGRHGQDVRGQVEPAAGGCLKKRMRVTGCVCFMIMLLLVRAWHGVRYSQAAAAAPAPVGGPRWREQGCGMSFFGSSVA